MNVERNEKDGERVSFPPPLPPFLPSPLPSLPSILPPSLPSFHPPFLILSISFPSSLPSFLPSSLPSFLPPFLPPFPQDLELSSVSGTLDFLNNIILFTCMTDILSPKERNSGWELGGGDGVFVS